MPFSESAYRVACEKAININDLKKISYILGNLVRLEGPDDWINLYADYDCAEKQVCDVLSIELHHADGRQEELAYPLNAAEKTVLFRNLGMYRTPDLSF